MRHASALRLRRGTLTGAALAAAMGSAVFAGTALANHPVFVEGNCFGPGAGMTATGIRDSPVPPGACGDYDGDGLIGAAEDADGDNNYGTINGALAAVAQNGRVTIVSDGTFPEIVTINPTNGGNVTLEAAQGVEANIDATVQGEPGGAARLGSAGITIDAAANSRVVVRNVTVRNWADGILIRGTSNATLDDLRLENNLNNGIHIIDSALATISQTDINATGFRKTGAGVGTPNPGIGLNVEGNARASLFFSSIVGSAAAGIRAPSQGAVEQDEVQLFNNNPNTDIPVPPPPPPPDDGAVAPACEENTNIPQVERGPGGNPDDVTLSATQLLINQRISQAAVRRVNEGLDNFSMGLTADDIRDCTVSLEDFEPVFRQNLLDGEPSSGEVVPVEPERPSPERPESREGDNVVLSRTQLLINQRISQAAIRRVNALRARLDAGITAGDIRRGTLDASVLDTQMRDLLGGGAPAASTVDVQIQPITPAPPGPRDPESVTLSRAQLLINQRISQEAVRRINQIRAELRAGLVGSQIRDGALVRANLTPELQRGSSG